jgi:transcriptional regulator with XRE-family HTH domain
MAQPGPSAGQAVVDQAFGRVLRNHRQTMGLSQEAIGLASGNGRTFVSQLERGERGASLKTLFRLAAVLKVPPSEIVRQVEAELSR